jgi:hypothetical protein
MTILATINVLPIDYEPTDNDIISGRGRSFNNHQGNTFFIEILKSNLQQYIDAPKRMYKSIVIDNLLSIIDDSGSRFIKKNTKTKQWYEMNRNESYKRVGHALRDLIYKSNSNAVQSKLAIKNQPPKEISNTSQNSSVSNEHLPALSSRVSASGSYVSGSTVLDSSIVSCSVKDTRDLSTTATTTNSDSGFNIKKIHVSSSSMFNNRRRSLRIEGLFRRSSLCRSYLDLNKEKCIKNFKF